MRFPGSFQFVALAALFALSGVPSALDAAQKVEAKLLLKPGRIAGRRVGYPVEFTAAPGETVGVIRAEIELPEEGWKFEKVELPRGSTIKVLARQEKPERGRKDERSTIGGSSPSAPSAKTKLLLTFSAGKGVIRDGSLGELQFSLPQKRPTAPEAPVVRVVDTNIPGTENAEEPQPAPFALPPEPSPNPSVTCFFFSH